MKIPVNRWLNFLGAIGAGLIVVGFCLILLWHDPLVFWNDDYELSVLPVFADVARSWCEGHWPLLSPYSWVCGNLAGEFQYGTFSFFVNASVILIWKFPLTFSQQAAALSITHLFVLAVGAFLLARDRRFSIPLSIFVALVASLNGWIICWGATDWFGALGAFAWLPWAWWGAERALDPTRTKWRFLSPAPFVYLVVTGGFPYTVVMLALLLVWLSLKSLAQTRRTWSILPLCFGTLLGLGLSAPEWLAVFDYVQGSARELQAASAHWQWRVPPTSLPGFILPCWTVQWTDFFTRPMPHPATELACGLVPISALIAGLISRGRELVREIKWELILLAVVLLLAMLPTAGLFRWSFRWLPFFHLVLAICAGEGLQMLPGGRSSLRWPGSTTPATTALVLVVLTAIAMSIFRTGGSYAFPLTWIFLGLAALWYFLEYFLRDSGFHGWTLPAITFFALLATYLCIRLHFINGYSPIRAAGVAREFYGAIHGEIDPGMGMYLLNNQAGSDGELARLGVDGIVVARELDIAPHPTSQWELVASTDEGRVFHRRDAPIARVRSVASIDPRPNEQFVSATISRISDSRNCVEADVVVPSGDRRALLTFSRPYFRGYEAQLGNRKLPVTSYRGLFPVVELPAGAHGRLTLTYRPYWLKCGSGAAVACALVILFGFFAAISQRS